MKNIAYTSDLPPRFSNQVLYSQVAYLWICGIRRH